MVLSEGGYEYDSTVAQSGELSPHVRRTFQTRSSSRKGTGLSSNVSHTGAVPDSGTFALVFQLNKVRQ